MARRPLTPRQHVRYGVLSIVFATVIILWNFFQPVYFAFEALMNLFMIGMGIVALGMGIRSVTRGRRLIARGVPPDQPVPRDFDGANPWDEETPNFGDTYEGAQDSAHDGAFSGVYELQKVPNHVCPACGRALPPRARFCPYCRAPVEGEPLPGESDAM